MNALLYQHSFYQSVLFGALSVALLKLMMMLLLQQLGLLMNDAGEAYGAQLGTTVGGASAHFAVQAFQAGSSACNK